MNLTEKIAATIRPDFHNYNPEAQAVYLREAERVKMAVLEEAAQAFLVDGAFPWLNKQEAADFIRALKDAP